MLKKKQAKQARAHGATQSLAIGIADAKKKKASDFWSDIKKGVTNPNN